MAQTLYIYADKQYRVNEKNEITYSPNCEKPSGEWLLTGAVTYNNFGHIVSRWSPDDIRAGKVPWTFKNGKPRSFICDRDHGTSRIWSRKIQKTRYLSD